MPQGALFLHAEGVLFPSSHRGLCSCFILYLSSVPTWPTTPFQDLVLLSQAPHRKFASLKVTFSLRVLRFKDYIFSYFFENWTVAEWNVPIFIKEQPDVVVLQGPLVEGGGISVVLHLEVGREGGVGHSAVKRLPNWAESRGKYATGKCSNVDNRKGRKNFCIVLQTFIIFKGH